MWDGARVRIALFCHPGVGVAKRLGDYAHDMPLPSNCANMIVEETVRGLGADVELPCRSSAASGRPQTKNKAMEDLTRNLDGAPAHRDPRMDMPQLNGTSVDDKLSARAGEAAPAPAELVADLRGPLPYKREPMRVYLGRAVRAARDGRGAR
jgi:hypothetical protein